VNVRPDAGCCRVANGPARLMALMKLMALMRLMKHLAL
jgi:hypothetical protein